MDTLLMSNERGRGILLLDPGSAISKRELRERLRIEELAAERPDHEIAIYLNTVDADNPFAVAIAIPKAAIAQHGWPIQFDDDRLVHVMRPEQLEAMVHADHDPRLTDRELRERYRSRGEEVPLHERRRRGWLDEDEPSE
jgi:hypothetical protein